MLPCLDEVRHGYLCRILDNLALQPGETELVVVLGPCADGTGEVVARHPSADSFKLVRSTATNRAQRLSDGIAASSGDVLLLHHPASLLPPDATLQVREIMAEERVAWGGFRHSFDLEHWLLRFTSWYSTKLRPRCSGVLYLDHCIFVRRAVLQEIGGIPDLDIFEDTALSVALRKIGPPHLASGTVVTSARRFRERGIYKHAVLNQILKLMYFAGMSDRAINWLYERKSQINVRLVGPKA